MCLLESLPKPENNFSLQKLCNAYSLSFFKNKNRRKWCRHLFLSLPFEIIKIWFQSGCVESHEAGRANKKSAIPRCWNLQRRSKGFCLRLNRKDFFRLHRFGNLKHAGIVACAQDSNPGALTQNIHHSVRDLESCLFGKSITRH